MMVCGLDHVEPPFHEIASPEPEVLPPTASQELAETHDTPWRPLTPEEEGRVWLVHVVPPFHESAAPPEKEELEPTASQKLAETHDTP